MMHRGRGLLLLLPIYPGQHMPDEWESSTGSCQTAGFLSPLIAIMVEIFRPKQYQSVNYTRRPLFGPLQRQHNATGASKPWQVHITSKNSYSWDAARIYQAAMQQPYSNMKSPRLNLDISFSALQRSSMKPIGATVYCLHPA